VLENLALAIRMRQGTGYRWWRGGSARRVAEAEANALLAQAGLAGHADARAGALAYGVQRIVDVLVSLALRPAVLLLDEPTAGLGRDEADRLLALVRTIRPDMAVVLIAHDLDLVFGACQRIAVLELGRLLAVDSPAAIRAHEGARRAYLGELA
jgi:branched-chain amino acid transport system ATP-binding protein